MRLTPLDIRKQEFTRGFRGYDPEEVQAFLQMVSGQWDEILDDSRRKDEKIRDLENKLVHYEKVEEALQEALQTARDTSRKALENAEDRARLIVDEAEKRAEEIKRDAEQDRHQVKRETAKLSGRRSEIVTRLRAFLMSEMEMLARYEGDDPVGFIKLLPSEEQRLRQIATESQSGTDRSDPAQESSTEPDTTTTFAPTPVHPTTDRQASDAHAAGHEQQTDIDAAPEQVVDSDSPAREQWPDHDYESPAEGGEEDYGADELAPQTQAESAAAQNQREEVMRGPGWTARTVISRPSEQTTSPADQAPEYEEEEEEDDESKTSSSSSDEIEKIRRILSGLD